MNKQVVAIYCCGGIKKGSKDKKKLIWGRKEFDSLSRAIFPVKAVFLSPQKRQDDVSDTFSVFGRDHFQISVCDFLVADLREKRGIGVGIEMLSAKILCKPVIAVAPINHHYRRERLNYLGGSVRDYVHAHLFGVADAIVNDFNEAGLWIKTTEFHSSMMSGVLCAQKLSVRGIPSVKNHATGL